MQVCRAVLSGSEVEALCAKAARGAGMDWGVADEAGYAARWLFEHGFAGPGALALVCNRFNHLGKTSKQGSSWRSDAGGDLCPIAVGSSVSDFGVDEGTDVGIAQVLKPILMVPFVHQLAHHGARTLQIEWRSGQVFVHPNGATSGMIRQLEKQHAARLSIKMLSDGPAIPAPTLGRSPVDDTTLALLETYALRTTVPATAASRRNAGATSLDND